MTRRRRACSCGRVWKLGFPLANKAQHGFLLRKSRHLQLEFPIRYRVANPVTWAVCRPYFYVPTRSVHVPPTSHLIPDKAASTSLLFYAYHLLHRRSHVQVHLRLDHLAPRCTHSKYECQRSLLPCAYSLSEMMAITQRTLVFAHVPSMRPIGGLEANGEVERFDCDPSRYIDRAFWDRTK